MATYFVGEEANNGGKSIYCIFVTDVLFKLFCIPKTKERVDDVQEGGKGSMERRE